MTEWTDEAIILRLGLFHEADLWVKILSLNHGVLTVFAFGGAKSKKRFCGCLDVLNIIQCHVKMSGRGGYFDLREASLLSAPGVLRHDWRKMGIAANCMLFMEAMNISEESSASCFSLLKNFSAFLEICAADYHVLPFFFRLRLVSDLGFAPDFKTCASCGKIIEEEHACFMPNEGRVFCDHCQHGLSADQNRMGFPVTARILRKLRHVQYSLPDQWLDEHMPEYDKRVYARIINEFVQYHLGITWGGGSFVKS